jgi:hypothetical protein
LLLALGGLPCAVGAIPNDAGTRNGNFLKLSTDARGTALGDAGISMPEGADALHWNPAGLSRLEDREVSASHVQYYQGVQMENVVGALPLGESGLALSGFYLNPGPLEGRDSQENPTGDFSFYDLVGTVGYGRRIFGRADGADVSVGAAVKIVQEKIADQQFQNPAFDVGALISPMEEVTIGISARNLSSSKANFARELIGGASCRIFRVFTGAFAVNYAADAPIRLSLGGEYRIRELENSAVRVGYTTHDQLDDSQDSQIKWLRGASVAGLTMGLGVGYKPPILPGVRVGLDYAMAPFGALGISHTLTVKISW